MSVLLDLNEIISRVHERLKIYTGYYKTSDGKFYKNRTGTSTYTYSNEIDASIGRMYIDLATDIAYIYDAEGSRYIPIGGNTDISSDNVTVTAGPVDSTQTITLTTALAKKNSIYYGRSTTAVGTAAKVITLQGIDPSTNWELKKGVIIAVSFSAGTNTANNPTFNVNGTGPKSVKYPVYNGTTVTDTVITSTNKQYAGTKVTQFYYFDGTNWVWFFGEQNEGTVKIIQINSTTFAPNASGVVDLGKVVRAINTGSTVNPNNQGVVDISDDFVSTITYDPTAKKVTSTKGSTTTDVLDKSKLEAMLDATNGVATLDNDGKVPSSQLPSFVDDVIDSYVVGATALSSSWLSKTSGGAALTPETDKIYVIVGPSTSENAKYLNKTYRWSGTTYVEISASLAIGTLAGSAFDGKRGFDNEETLNDHIADNTRHITSAERTTWNGLSSKVSSVKDYDGTTITPDPTNHIVDLSVRSTPIPANKVKVGTKDLSTALSDMQNQIDAIDGGGSSAVQNVFYKNGASGDNVIYQQKGYASSTTIEPIIDMSPFSMTEEQLNAILNSY